jgi:putative peptide zinc metalloprotease protein
MAGTNPTFSESWYRVAQLRPRLRATVQTRRQHFRGQVWHIVQDPANNSYFRLHPAAYRFIAMLDGRRSVADAWRSCTAALGDESLTQTEVVAVLGQLYSANLIQADLPPDAEGLFRRHQKRRGREIRAWLTNILFLRVPVFDPDRLLGALAAAVGWVFSPVGLLLWLALLGVGVYFAAGAWDELAGRTRQLLQSERILGFLPALYGAMVLTKVVHELGHGLACKRFGRLSRGGGEVHVMGIMLLIFTPMPYVDASSAWALRSKLHRCMVGAAGMMAELALAALAAVAWVWTAGAADPWQQGLHAACFYMMLISGVSTIVFNANPLLRFDGYYILSDLLEIPNLAERSRQDVKYLVKRYGYGVRGAIDVAQGPGERAWLLGYGLASTAFKLYVSVRILLFLTERYFEVGLAAAAVMAVAWLVLPLGHFLKYLATDAELARTRARALAVTAAAVLPVAAALALPDAPDRWPVEGTVEPVNVAYIHAGADGFVDAALPDDSPVQGPADDGSGATVLISAVNRQLAQDANDLEIAKEIMAARRRVAQLHSAADPHDLALVQILDASLASLDKQHRLARQELAGLTVRSPIRGRWTSTEADFLRGAYIRKGRKVGKVVAMDPVMIVADCPHRLAGMLLAEALPTAEIRIVGQPATKLVGTWKIRPAGARGENDAPVQASSVNPATKAEGGLDGAAFELVVTPSGPGASQLMPGQSAVVRLDLPPRPLLWQWWRSIRQMAQRRLGLF